LKAGERSREIHTVGGAKKDVIRRDSISPSTTSGTGAGMITFCAPL
jgi:hypothetical protein